MFCPNTSDPHIKAEFDRYAELLGSNKIAGLLYHKNNGNFLDKTPNGEDSILFQQLVRITGGISKALKVKAQYYTDAYLAKNNWLESGIEPIEELDNLAVNSRLLAQYQADNLETKYALERLPEGGSAFVTDIQFKNRKQNFTVKNKHIKPAAGVSNGVKFWMPSIDTNIKKYIVDAYFRLDPNKMPYYPFSLGNVESNIQRVKLINSEFEDGQEAVRYNPTNDTIEFGKDILYARPTSDRTRYNKVIEKENNPAERQKEVLYQNNTNQSEKDYIASEKIIRDLAARISDRIGIHVKFESDRTKKYKGKIENGVAYINLAYATLDPPIHEILGHPIIRAIKNKEISKFSGTKLTDFSNLKGFSLTLNSKTNEWEVIYTTSGYANDNIVVENQLYEATKINGKYYIDNQAVFL